MLRFVPIIVRNTFWTVAFAWATFPTETCIATDRQTPPSPVGQFECRDWESESTTLQAVLVLHVDGSYEATDRVDDLNAHRPTTTGQYVFEADKQKISWTSGNWKNRLGTYIPNVKGTDFIVVHTKRDPDNKTDGTLRCARIPLPQ